MCVCLPEEDYSFKGKQKKGEMGKLFKGIGNKLTMCCSYLYRTFISFLFWACEAFQLDWFQNEKESYVNIFLSGLVSDVSLNQM